LPSCIAKTLTILFDFELMRCKKCKNELEVGQQFCTNCGVRFSDSTSFTDRIFVILKAVTHIITKRFLVGVLIFSFIFFTFYWFAYLPKEHRSNCHELAVSEVGGYDKTKTSAGMQRYENAYEKCLRSYGIK